MNLVDLGIQTRQSGRAEQRAPCPRCAKGNRDRDYTLGVNVETCLFHCFRCGWSGRASEGASTEAPRVTRLDDPRVAERKRERLRRTWAASVALDHKSANAVRRYLEARGLGAILKAPPRVLRAHPGLPYFDGPHELGTYPTMLALYENADARAVTLHATWLRNDGTKAPVPSPRKILGVPVRGSTKGGAIRLHAPEHGRLGVAEGIETALSLHLLQSIPVWASFCADNLAHMRLPHGLRELLIGVDVDESGKGEQVANALADRVIRWRDAPKVFLVRPSCAAPCDLNDELKAAAHAER